jgi:integrase
VVKAAAKRSGIQNLAPHDLRRTCARLCHLAGGELEQIQFLLGAYSGEVVHPFRSMLSTPGAKRRRQLECWLKWTTSVKKRPKILPEPVSFPFL